MHIHVALVALKNHMNLLSSHLRDGTGLGHLNLSYLCFFVWFGLVFCFSGLHLWHIWRFAG